MITNTPENKTRFFALYWGQPVMRHDPSGHWGAKITAYTMKALSEGNYLELRPLSNITNEEAIEVAKIECRNYGTALEKIFPKGFSLRNQIGDKEYSGIYFDYVTDEAITERGFQMTESQIQNLMDALFKKRVTKNSYGGGTYQSNLIDEDFRVIIESMIRSAILDGRDEKVGIIEAKLFAYEQIIANSNFAPMIDGCRDRDSLIRENERLRRSLQEITEMEVPEGERSDVITNYIGGVLSVAHEGLRSVEEGGVK